MRYLALLIVPALVAATAAIAAPPKPKALQLRSTDLGRVIVDAKKRTLYMLTADAKNASSCSSRRCAGCCGPAACSP